MGKNVQKHPLNEQENNRYLFFVYNDGDQLLLKDRHKLYLCQMWFILDILIETDKQAQHANIHGNQ